MDAMREVLRDNLARSLGAAAEEDRLAAAWTVACGPTMAGRGRIASYDRAVVRVAVADPVWLRQMSALSSTLTRELARISGLPVRQLQFVLERP